jgi:hypothetical protein
LAVVLAGWTGLRAVLLWPVDLTPNIGSALARAESYAPATREPSRAPRALVVQRVPPARPVRLAATRHRPSPIEVPPGPQAHSTAGAVSARIAAAQTDAVPATSAAQVPLAPLPAGTGRSRSRWSGDLWLALRPGDAGGLGVGQLGGSQGGVRVTYALDGARRLALSARAFAPLGSAGAEAALGLDIRPTRAPVHLLLEQRFPVDGGGSQPAVALIAGGSLGLPRRLRLDGYGQAGAIRRRGGFADGAAQLVAPVTDRSGVRLEAGGGIWGAAQRGAARLDLGPSAAVVLPARGAALRLQLDYRVRVAGDARPGSGPALSLGGSF